MEPRDIEVGHRFLRQLLFGLALAKYPLKPPKGLAEIAAKARRQGKIVRDKAAVMLVSLPFGQLQRVAELLLGSGPVALGDQAKAACIGTLEKRFGTLSGQLFGLFEELESLGITAAPPREARERVKGLGFAAGVVLLVQERHRPLEEP